MDHQPQSFPGLLLPHHQFDQYPLPSKTLPALHILRLLESDRSPPGLSTGTGSAVHFLFWSRIQRIKTLHRASAAGLFSVWTKPPFERSEERRVGKECRSRRSEYK